MREGIGNKSFYNPEAPSWWLPSRQRIVVLTFPTAEEAAAWDEKPDLTNLTEEIRWRYS